MKIKLSIAVTTMLLGSLSNLQATPLPSEFNINQSTGDLEIVSNSTGGIPDYYGTINVTDNSKDQTLTINNGAMFLPKSSNTININNSENFIINNNGDLRTKSGSVIFVNKDSKLSMTNNNFIGYNYFEDPVKAIENNGNLILTNTDAYIWGGYYK